MTRKDRQRDMRREVVLVAASHGDREDAVAGHREDDSRARVQAGHGQGEEAGHGADFDDDAHPAHAQVLAEGGQRSGELVERGIVVGQSVGFHIGDEDEECAGDQQAGDDRAGDGDQRLLGLFAERGGTFEADAAEDRHRRTPKPMSPRPWPCVG